MIYYISTYANMIMFAFQRSSIPTSALALRCFSVSASPLGPRCSGKWLGPTPRDCW